MELFLDYVHWFYTWMLTIIHEPNIWRSYLFKLMCISDIFDTYHPTWSLNQVGPWAVHWASLYRSYGTDLGASFGLRAVVYLLTLI